MLPSTLGIFALYASLSSRLSAAVTLIVGLCGALPQHDSVFNAFHVNSWLDLCVRYPMRPAETKNTLETFHVMSLQIFYTTAIGYSVQFSLSLRRIDTKGR